MGHRPGQPGQDRGDRPSQAHPQQGRQLQHHNDRADPRHEARDHGVGHHRDVLAQLHQAKQHLESAGQQGHGEGHCQAAGLAVATHQQGDHGGHDHCHRAGGPRHLGGGAAEQGRQEAQHDGAGESGHRSGSGGHAKGQRQGEGYHCGGEAAGEIPAPVVQGPHRANSLRAPSTRPGASLMRPKRSRLSALRSNTSTWEPPWRNLRIT